MRGASPPSGHQSPDTSEIRLWVCGERNATQSPFPRSPAQITRTSTHTDVAPARTRSRRSRRDGRARGPEMARRLRLAAPGRGRSPSPSPLAGATEVPGVTGPAPRRNGRSGPAASAARAGRERPPDTAGRRGCEAGGDPGRDGRGRRGRTGSRCALRTRSPQPPPFGRQRRFPGGWAPAGLTVTVGGVLGAAAGLRRWRRAGLWRSGRRAVASGLMRQMRGNSNRWLRGAMDSALDF